MTTATAPIEQLQTPRRADSTPDAEGMFSDALYRYHGFRVLDARGETVGTIDWIWANDATGAGEYVGLHLQWLRGKARAVPVAGAAIDTDTATIRLVVTRQQISNARRFHIDRSLTAGDRIAIAAHFQPSASAARVWSSAASPRSTRAYRRQTGVVRRIPQVSR